MEVALNVPGSTAPSQRASPEASHSDLAAGAHPGAEAGPDGGQEPVSNAADAAADPAHGGAPAGEALLPAQEQQSLEEGQQQEPAEDEAETSSQAPAPKPQRLDPLAESVEGVVTEMHRTVFQVGEGGISAQSKPEIKSKG